MSMEIDGAAILAALARDPAAFAMTKPQLDALATAAVTAKLREKSLSLAVLRSMAAAVGPHDFSTIVGGLPAATAKGLAKIDARHPDYAAADAHWHRAHIIRLAKREAEPQAAPSRRPAQAAKPAPLPAARKLPKIGRIMASEAQATAGKARKARAES